MVASDEIRREGVGSGSRGTSPAANSRAEDRAEKPAPGAATDRPLSLVMPLEGGGEVRFFAVHGRVDMQIRVGKQRSWLTTPVSDRRAREYGERLVMISDLAFSQRQAQGA